MGGCSFRGVLIVVGVASAALFGLAVPASAHGSSTTYPSVTYPSITHAPCGCSTTTTTPPTTTTTPATTSTTEATSTSVGGVTSTMHTTTTYIHLYPPITVLGTTTTVVEQHITTTTHGTGKTGRLPFTGSSSVFPTAFGLGCLIVGAVLALRRKPREWYGR